MPIVSQSHIDRKRQDILSAALEVFASKGFHAAKISDIAARLGMGHGTFYRYFDNKLDIFSSLLDQMLEQIGALVLSESPTASDSLEAYRAQLTRIGERLFALYAADQRLARILVYEALGVDPTLNAKLENMMQLAAGHTMLYLQNGIDKGFLRSDLDPQLAARAVNAMIIAALNDLVHSNTPQPLGQRWAAIIAAIMLDGLRA